MWTVCSSRNRHHVCPNSYQPHLPITAAITGTTSSRRPLFPWPCTRFPIRISVRGSRSRTLPTGAQAGLMTEVRGVRWEAWGTGRWELGGAVAKTTGWMTRSGARPRLFAATMGHGGPPLSLQHAISMRLRHTIHLPIHFVNGWLIVASPLRFPRLHDCKGFLFLRVCVCVCVYKARLTSEVKTKATSTFVGQPRQFTASWRLLK